MRIREREKETSFFPPEKFQEEEEDRIEGEDWEEKGLARRATLEADAARCEVAKLELGARLGDGGFGRKAVRRRNEVATDLVRVGGHIRGMQ